MRGIIPAMWLDEIERRTLKPVSHLFNTSCGGIIAAWLAALNYKKIVKTIDNEGNTDYEDLISTYQPKFTANEIVQLFKTKSKKIFSSDKSSFFLFILLFGKKKFVSTKIYRYRKKNGI